MIIVGKPESGEIMEAEHKSCQERIGDKLEGRLCDMQGYMENPEGNHECPRCGSYDTKQVSLPRRLLVYHFGRTFRVDCPSYSLNWDRKAKRTIPQKTVSRLCDRYECNDCGRVFRSITVDEPAGLSPEDWLCCDWYGDEERQEGYYRLELSYGGPQDYFEIHLVDGEITGATYHFLDWGDGATWGLGGDYLRILRAYAAATGLV